MTLRVQILIPAGQTYEAEIVTVDSYGGEVRKSEPVKLTPGQVHDFYATSTRSFELREIVPAPVVEAPAVEPAPVVEAEPETPADPA